MTIFKVEIEERLQYVVWVEADSAREAEETADEVVDSAHEVDHETDTYAKEDTPVVDEQVWTGGDDGRWVKYSELKGKR